MTVVDYPVLRESRHPTAAAAPEQADWLNWLELGGTAERTRDDYCWATDRLLEAWPKVAFANFDDSHLLYVLRRFPQASLKTRAAGFRSWFKWGVKTRRRLDNPCDLLPDFKPAAPPLIQVFTEAEERALESLPSPDGQLMTVLFEAGLRKSEAMNVRSGDFNLETRDLAVTRGAKGGKHRVVIITQRLAVAVDELRTLEGLNPGDYLWGTRERGGTDHSRPKLATPMQWWWRTRLEAAGVDYRKLHTTRHTFATRWRERGLPLDDLQAMLGHSDIKTTMMYRHTELRDIRKRMDALLPESET